MTLGAYNLKRGWQIPENENPEREGFFIEYPDGYISWSPKEVFEEAYRETNKGLTFGHAIEALKKGLKVSREGWNGKGMFIFMQIPAIIDGSIIPKMQSLPNSVKEQFQKRFDLDPANAQIKYKNQLAMVYPDNTIYGWVASPSDVLEEDWCILD